MEYSVEELISLATKLEINAEDEFPHRPNHCNCESIKCNHEGHRNGKACKNIAGKKKVHMLGRICDECSTNIPKEYMKDANSIALMEKYSQQRPQPLFPKQQAPQPKVMNAPSSDPAFNNVPYESYSGKAPPTAGEVSVDQINKMRTVAYESYQKIQQLQKEFEQVAAELKTILT